MRQEQDLYAEKQNSPAREALVTPHILEHIRALCRDAGTLQEREAAEARAFLTFLPPYFSMRDAHNAVAYFQQGRELLSNQLRSATSADMLGWLPALYAYQCTSVSWHLSGDAMPHAGTREKLVSLLREWRGNASPELRLEVVRTLHESDAPLQDGVLDFLFGIQNDESALGLSEEMDWAEYIANRTTYTSTPYAYLAAIVRDMARNGVHSITDIGSGVGRMMLYSSAVSAVRCLGIEADSELVRTSNAAADALGLDSHAVHEDALCAEYGKSGAVFLYNSFETDDEQLVQERTRECIAWFLKSSSAGSVFYGFGHSNIIVEQFRDLREDEQFSAESIFLNPMHSDAVVRNLAYRPRKFIVKK